MTDENKGPLSGKEPTDWQGPLRPAPRYYIGERVGKRPTTHADTYRLKNGTLPGIRDKGARRVIRAAFKRKFTAVEQGLKLARAMKAQAFELARGEHKSTRWARRLLDKELAIHTPVYVPDQKELRAMRTAARKAKRRGEQDVIGQLVDRLAEQKP